MTITSPQLDDLTFDRIATELVRRIPVYSPEWTDYNDSDPGITLIQLFAYLGEMIGYRLNQVPQKSQANLLELLGIMLSPAVPSKTQLALLLTDPSKLTAFTLAKGASIKASKGSPPPAFETDRDLVVVPAEPVALVTTVGPELWAPWSPGRPRRGTDYLTVTWDGKTPKLQDMPLAPVTLAPVDNQRYLWIGVNFNSDQSAGFKAATVQLTLQYDADDQPSLTSNVKSGPKPRAAQGGKLVDWLWYFDAEQNQMLQVPGLIDDTTGQLAASGTISFVVPSGIGPIPADSFQPMFPPVVAPPDAIGAAYVRHLQTNVGPLLPPARSADPHWIQHYATAMATTLQETLRSRPPHPSPAVPNPLDPKFYSTSGWFRIGLQASPAAPTATAKLRIAIFNAVSVTNATTVTNELVGVADGTPGQTYKLANTNIQPGTLSLAVQEQSAADNAPLVPWTEVANLDASGPFDRVFVLDAEAGSITFGDGIHGRIPPLVPQGGNIVALNYVWGGGSAGNVPVGMVTVMNSPAPGIAAAVNYVPATGGRDAETQAQAQIRATKTLSSGSRAVSVDDFAWLAQQTPGVQVARTQVVPLRRPLTAAPVTQGQQNQATPAGLCPVEMPGVVTVVVVPQVAGPEPTPSADFLQAVAQYLDTRRLLTSEVYVAPPQFARLKGVQVSVAASPGFTRAQLQASVSARLATYLHVLTGGSGGTGFPFGGELRVSDLVAQIYQVDGVVRVDTVTAPFTRTGSAANPQAGTLVQIPDPQSSDQYQSLTLAPEENVSFDAASFVLSLVV